MKLILTILSIFFITKISLCQIGGQHTFQFLNLPQSARITALGSSQIVAIDSDIILGLQSPSLINGSMHKSLSVNHNFHLADISYGTSAMGYHIEKLGLTALLGFTYLSYGDFTRTDEIGNVQGDFSGKDNAIILGAAKKMNERMSVGVNLKWATSRLDNYTSSGLGIDIGLTYENPEKSTITTLVVKNIGAQFSSFNEDKEGFPLDVQIGSSRRLKYLPLRLSFILHDLQKWNLRSDGLDDNDPIFIDQAPRENSALSNGIDNLFHHLIFSGEFLIGQNDIFRLRFGYNHQLKNDLKVSSFRSLGGFSFGFGFKVKKLAFDYGFGSYHLAGGMNHISLSTNLQEWGKL